MRVAIVHEQVDVRRGGAETSVVEMAGAIAARGVSVTVLFRGQRPGGLVRDNVMYEPLAAGGGGKLLQTYRFVQAATRACRGGAFDVVHAVTPVLCADVYQPRGGLYAEAIARSLAPEQSPLWRGLRRLGRRFNMRQRFLMRIERVLLTRRRERVWVAALSEYVRQQALSHAAVPPSRVRVVFNGVSGRPAGGPTGVRELRARLGIGPDSPLLLFVAHNFKLKGLGELLGALAAAGRDGAAHERASRAVLLVCGRDRAEPYEARARRLGLADRVRFVGPVEDLSAWYAAADALAHPTWYDPCSRVVLEALSSGLPAVTTRWNGAADVMEPGRHGEVLAEPDDTAALAAALERVLDPRVRAACRADAARLAGLVSMDRHAAELVALYEDVLAARRG
ncbi:MAG: glycosyltransferase family 4 protein [Phycisphaerales bacterium]|nr:glycosyltransferase family 4 protein [Phycisphaerales bacterium]